MPAKIITSSSNISILNSKIVADLCGGNFLIDLTPSTFIGAGDNAMLGAKVRITNPYNVPIKDFSADYDILPPFTSTFTSAISTAGNSYEYGEFTIDVQITDADNATYTVTKPVDVRYPDAKRKDRNYGSLSADIKGICNKGTVYVSVDSVPNYKGIIYSGSTQSYQFEFPTGSNLPVATRTINNFSDYLFEGVYNLKGEMCVTYNGTDDISYKIKYKVAATKNVLCQVNECAVLANLVELNKGLNENCSEEVRLEKSSITLDALRLLKTAQLANECGEDASEYIEELNKLFGYSCNDDLGAAPVVSAQQSQNVTITGCNITSEDNGLTTTYNINNYDYIVKVAENGGFLTASVPQLTDCTKTTTLTFDIAKVYTQIKTYANTDINEANFWASVVNKSITSATPPAGTDQNTWNSMTFLQRLQTIINKIAAVAASIPSIPATPDVPPTPDFLNGVALLVPRSGTTPAKVGLGSPLTFDTTILGAYKLAFTQARIGIGMQPVFQLDVYNQTNNLGAQITSQLGLVNGQPRIGLLSAMQIMGSNPYTASGVGQVAGSTGQLVFYNSAAHGLNSVANYSGHTGIFIGYATADVTGGVVSSLSAITYLGKSGNYSDVAGLRISAPVGSEFTDATDFTGTVTNYYAILISLFNAGTFGSGTITNHWGIYQRGSQPHRFGGKIVWDATINPSSVTGEVTINKPMGVVYVAAGATSAVVNNSMVTTSSVVWVQHGTVEVVGDSTATALNKTVTAIEANGYFTIFLSSSHTAPVRVKFWVNN